MIFMILKVFLLLLSIIPLTAVRHYLDLRAHEIFTQHNKDKTQPVNLNNQMEVEKCAQFFRKKEVKIFKEMLFFSAFPLFLPLCNISLSELKSEPKFAPICVIPIAISAAIAFKKFLDTGIYVSVVNKYEKELSEFYSANRYSVTFCLQRAGDMIDAGAKFNGPYYQAYHAHGQNHQ